MQNVHQSLTELITRTSTTLPKDVLQALREKKPSEEKNTSESFIYDTILRNCELAAEKVQPICQDTGFPTFYVKHGHGLDKKLFEETIKDAVAECTQRGLLRNNTTNSITGKSIDNNLGMGLPAIHFEYDALSSKNEADVRLLLKGGGSENVSGQHSLPDESLRAERNMEGVKKAVLETVWKAQGLGCAPCFLGISIGGDRTVGYIHAKKQLLRKISDKNINSMLAKLEDEIIDDANKLGIGPMGLGGHPTLLGCKIGVLDRHPASYYVTISYMCWAFRRNGVRIGKDGEILEWLY